MGSQQNASQKESKESKEKQKSIRMVIDHQDQDHDQICFSWRGKNTHSKKKEKSCWPAAEICYQCSWTPQAERRYLMIRKVSIFSVSFLNFSSFLDVCFGRDMLNIAFLY